VEKRVYQEIRRESTRRIDFVSTKVAGETPFLFLSVTAERLSVTVGDAILNQFSVTVRAAGPADVLTSLLRLD